MTAQERIASLSTPTWTLAALAASVESGLVAALDEPREVGRARRAHRAPGRGRRRAGRRAGDHGARRAHRRALGRGRGARAGDARAAARRCCATTCARPCCRASPSFTTARVEPHALGGWRHTDEDLLQAQGRLSASVIPLLADVLFPHVPGLLDRLGSGSGAFLDVGAGVAARQHRDVPAVPGDPGGRPRARVGAAGARAAQRRGRGARGPHRAARPARRGARRRGGLRRGLAAGELPPRRRLRHRPDAPCTARCGPAACCSPARSTAAARMARRPSRRLRLALWGGGDLAPARSWP